MSRHIYIFAACCIIWADTANASTPHTQYLDLYNQVEILTGNNAAPKTPYTDLYNKILHAQTNLARAREREQSLENRMIGAAAIAAVGTGLMNAMSANAEKNADQAAEADMRAYLATFACDYGQGRTIRGGTRNIDLPGGNALTDMVNEYKALAASLRTRKEALGLKPGIESEEIIDIADAGLYDNAARGRQSGAYISLSHALTDETGTDATAWQEQKDTTTQKQKTGLITAAAGAVGSAVASGIVNHQSKNDEADKHTDTPTNSNNATASPDKTQGKL